MPRTSRDPSTDLGLLALALIWGVNFSVMKAVLEELDPLALNALRFPLAALALWAVAPSGAGRWLPEREDRTRILALGILGHVVYQLCFIYSLDWTLAGNASLLLSTTPVWTVLLSAGVGHERAGPRVIVGILATLVGIALVVIGRGDTVELGSETLRGDLLMILAAVLWSIYTVGGRGPIAKYGPLRTTAWTLWVGTPVVVALGVPSLRSTELSTVSMGAWLGVAYAGFLSVGLAYLLWYRGVQKLGNTRTAVYSNLVPVAALLTAWLWLGEVPTGTQLAGAAVILAGLTASRLAQSPGPSSLRWRSSGNS